MDFNQVTFTDSNGEPAVYDGSEVAWRVSAYAVIVKDKQIFLVRGKDENLFDVVGGGVEFGETVKDALVREAKEEAGANIKVGKLLSFHQDYFYHSTEKKFYQTLLLYFVANVIGDLGKPQDKNIQFNQFVHVDSLADYPMLQYIRAIVTDYLKNDQEKN